MAYFWLFAFLGLIFLDKLRRIRVDTIVRQHQFALYALRDELREAALHGEIDPKNWVFQYLDSSIVKTISYLKNLNLWRLLFIAGTYRRDRRFLAAREHLQHELKKPTNEFLASIHYKYALHLGGFMIHRHLSLRVVMSALFAAISVVQFLKRTPQLAPVQDPVLSELSEFAPELVTTKKTFELSVAPMRKYRRAIEYTTEAPATSTLIECAPA